MMAEGGEDDVAIVKHKRVCKPTERALEEQLHRRISLRRAKLSALTNKIKGIEELMTDDGNLLNVQDLMQNEFAQLLTEFTDLNVQVQDLLPEDEKIADQKNWVGPKMDSLRLFERKMEDWLAAVSNKKGQSDEMEDDVAPHDSASQVSMYRTKSKQKHGSDIESGSISSSILSARAREESKRAALLARAAALKKKQQLEIEKMQLTAKMEELEIETALAESNAKIMVLNEYEHSEDGRSSVRSKQRKGIHLKQLESKTEQRGYLLCRSAVGKSKINAMSLAAPQVGTSKDTGHGATVTVKQTTALYRLCRNNMT